MPFITIWVPGWEDLEHWGTNTASILQGNNTYQGNTLYVNTLYGSLGMLITTLAPICVAFLFWNQMFVRLPREDTRASARVSRDEEGTPPPYSVSANQSQPGTQQKVGVPVYSKSPSYRKKCNKNHRKIRILKGRLNLVVAFNKGFKTQLRTQNRDLEDGNAEREILKLELQDSVAGIEALEQQLEDNNHLIDSLDERIGNRNAQVNDLTCELAHRQVDINDLNRKIAFWETCIQNHRAKFTDVSKFANENFWAVMRMGRLADDLAPLHLPVRVATALTEIGRVRDRVREMRRQLVTPR